MPEAATGRRSGSRFTWEGQASLKTTAKRTRLAGPSERARGQIRRILLMVDTLAPCRLWKDIADIHHDVCERLGETVCEKTIYRDLQLLASLGMADRREGTPSQWMLVLRNSESVQTAALDLYPDPPKPEKLKTWKLTGEQAQKILDSNESYGRLARRYGVTKGAVWQIKTRRTWKHLIPSSEAALLTTRAQSPTATADATAGRGKRWTSKAMTINEGSLSIDKLHHQRVG